MSGVCVSIIVPTLNEAAFIGPFLRQLRERASGAEIVLVDGGSDDGTLESAQDMADRVLVTARGRAVQMNAGAAVASGDVLWFLHADSDVPNGCLTEIAEALRDPHAAGGYFRIRFPKPDFAYRLTDSLGHYLGLLLRLRCGDHGIFCRRETFDAADGYPEVPLMEDVALFRALHRCGRMRPVRTRMATSPRRYEEIGPYRLTAAYALIALLYLTGVCPESLARLYGRLCVAR
jgi:rSAM/selenodomain-associated transferase 2